MTIDAYLQSQLQLDREHNLERTCELLDPNIIPFCLNDYLGFARHPIEPECPLSKSLCGSGASRVAGGSKVGHEQCETALAHFKGADAALLFNCGYMAACGGIPALAGPDDLLILDELAHACLWDGAKLSGARLRAFKHNDPQSLLDIIRSSSQAEKHSKIGIIVESLYSMDGDLAPLKDIIEIKERCGAWLWVDEAHASGVYGPCGQGLCAEAGLSSRVDIQMGTLGKALGVMGGFLAGSDPLIRFLKQRCRTFLFTTAMPESLALAIIHAVEITRSDEGEKRRQHLKDLIKLFHDTLSSACMCPGIKPTGTMIIPWQQPSVEDTLKTKEHLLQRGFYAPAIRFPTVPKNSPRLRFSINSSHTREEIFALCDAIKQIHELRTPR